MTNRILVLAAVVLGAAVAAPIASADDVVPFPGARTGKVFLAAQTVRPDGAISNFFAPGDTVVFRAYGVDRTTRKLVRKKQIKSFVVAIPNRPNLKLHYTPKQKAATGRFAWTARWKVPAAYPLGIVAFKVVVRTKAKRTGSFKQIPVASSQLTITTTPQLPPGGGPGSTSAPTNAKVDVALYADTVNGTRPAGTTPRPIGCTQTNVFKRGEQLVVRTWGFDLTTGRVLSIDNVTQAFFSVPGVPNIALNWGAHGPADARVWFWSNQWQIPTTYPLGDVTLQIQFTTTTGKVGKLGYPITIIP